MRENRMTRRDYLKLLGAGSTMAAMGATTACTPGQKEAPKQAPPEPGALKG